MPEEPIKINLICGCAEPVEHLITFYKREIFLELLADLVR
jgi:hypothetical protein